MVITKNKIWSALLDGLFPRHCPVCDEIVEQRGEKICLACLDRLKPLLPPYCMKCGGKVEESALYCKDCSRIKHVFDGGRSLYEYDGAAESIYRLKYGGRQEYAEFFGEQIYEYLGDYIRELNPDGIVPVPLHKARKRKRGFNQAELIAKALGNAARIKVYPKYLNRVRNTIPLKLLNPRERQNNLKKAFKIVQNDVKLDTIILIDDIYTTGSTMDEISNVLRENGTKKIYFITLTCGAGV